MIGVKRVSPCLLSDASMLIAVDLSRELSSDCSLIHLSTFM